MLDLTQLNKIDINNQESFSEIKEKVDDIMLHQDSKEAKLLYDFINQKVTEDKNIYNKEEYDKILNQLKFLDLYFLSDNEIVNLYQNHFGKILEYYEDYDPFNNLRLKLINIPLDSRDQFKKRIVLALMNNKENITSQALFFDEGGISEPPSIANWIKDYTKIAGGGVFTNLAKANYFIRSKNYLALNEEERQKVKVFLNFYFRLQLSSLTPQGLENDLVFVDRDGRTKILSEGKIIDTKDMTIERTSTLKKGLGKKAAKEATDNLSDISQEVENDLVEILEKEILDDIRGDFDQLIQMLRRAVEIGSREEIIAILQILKNKGRINDIQKTPELLEGLKEIGILDRQFNERSAEVSGVSKRKKVTTASRRDIKELMKEVLIGKIEEEREIKRLEVEIREKEGDDVQKLINGLSTAGEVKEVIARFRLLARIDPGSFAKISGSKKESSSFFDFQRLIKSVLGGRFGLSEAESARYGMQVAMILKKQKMPEFIKAVYFDKKDKVFRWNTK